MAAAYCSILDKWSRAASRRRGGAPKASGCAFSSRCFATASYETGRSTSSAPGLAGLRAAVRLSCGLQRRCVHEARGPPAGAAVPTDDQRSASTIDNGNHLVLSGNQATLAYLDAIGARGARRPPRPSFAFVDLTTGERWLRPNDGPIPWWILDPRRRTPGHRLARISRAARRCCARRRTRPSTRTISCAGPLYERLSHPFCSPRSTSTPGRSAASPAAWCARPSRHGRAQLSSADRARRAFAAFVDPALAFLEARGGAVRFGGGCAGSSSRARARRARFRAWRDRARADDAVILAVPPSGRAELLPGLAAPDEFRAIVNAHYRIEPPPGRRR